MCSLILTLSKWKKSFLTNKDPWFYKITLQKLFLSKPPEIWIEGARNYETFIKNSFRDNKGLVYLFLIL